ncbi:cell wall-binding repeat-containing protein [Clostridioides sp. ES-S-0108-01]|uniref:cell wall-binding repeat-containing protein n=1 Tax=unclassified Clostridioides TaxID=2635829 RepID=UPI001D0CA7ED|nr:cell wall-binding repeat-containing protein [Clostridioides sp. ES-S-0107-01]MCC0784518.1 cell wall-binding repeat-containing protein [Clostridioides sp. ES-S-0108-01]UDN53070.1 cell wall-binding repeat-containing protein [Clostridioides sp. ES-S-0107-01]
MKMKFSDENLKQKMLLQELQNSSELKKLHHITDADENKKYNQRRNYFMNKKKIISFIMSLGLLFNASNFAFAEIKETLKDNFSDSEVSKKDILDNEKSIQDDEFVDIQDKEFEAFIKSELNKQGIVINDRIKAHDMLQIRELKITENFNSIQGIEYCKNLAKLTCFSSLDLTYISDLKLLREMSVIIDQTADISQLNTLKNLKYLTIFSNDESNAEIDLSNISMDLKCLKISRVNISNLDTRNINGLEELQLYNTGAIDINEIKDTSITKLSIVSSNDISNHIVLKNLDNLNNLPGLEELTLSNLKINNLEFLSNLTNLTVLNLSNNNISDISNISNLNNITELKLSNNNISSIESLKNLINLEKLDLSSNNIENVNSLSSLNNLRNLSINYNNIFDISELKNIKGEINAHNQEVILPFESISEFDKIEIENPVKSNDDINFDFNGIFNKVENTLTWKISNETFVSAKFNNNNGFSGTLTVPIEVNSDIKINIQDKVLEEDIKQSLRDQNIYVDTIRREDLANLRYLRISDNVKSLEGIQYCRNLNNLVLNTSIDNISQVNMLKKLNKLTINTTNTYDLSFLKNLENLETLEYNDISEINKDIFDLDSFNDLSNLKSIKISNRNISNNNDLNKLVNLTSLELNNTNITNLKCIKDLKNLEKLYISSNEYAENEINLNEIKEISSLKNLEDLKIENVKLEDLTGIDNLTNLKNLNLDNNNIKNIELLKNLTCNMSLNNNAISDISMLDFNKLKNNTINISNQKIILETIQINSDIVKLENPIRSNGVLTFKNKDGVTYNALEDIFVWEFKNFSKTKVDFSSNLDSKKFFNGSFIIRLVEGSDEDVVDIKDTNLKTIIEKELVSNSVINKGDAITKSDLNKIKSLKITGDVKNLDILKYCDNIMYLNCYSEVTSIESLKYLKNLKELSINVSELENCSLDAIKDLIDLEKIEIIGNGNDFLDLSNLIKLKKLKNLKIYGKKFINGNVLKELNLKELNLTNNGLNDISFLADLNLEILSIMSFNSEDNQSTLNNLNPLKNMLSLKKLCITGTNINNIDALENLKNLEVLNLSQNNINNINCLKNLINLNELNLNSNSISSIFQIKNLIKLKKLDLSFNIIDDISDLKNLRNLVQIQLNSNRIKELKNLEELTNLETLNLSYNKIKSIEEIKNLRNLKNLRINNNNVTSIEPLNALSGCTIDSDYNKIYDISNIDLSKNTISLNNQKIDVIGDRINEDDRYVTVKNICKSKSKLNINVIDGQYNEIENEIKWEKNNLSVFKYEFNSTSFNGEVYILLNSIATPIIEANDIMIEKGSSFNPFNIDIFAVDREGNDITDRIKVIKNTVDINKTGMYEVTYKVTDDDNLSAEKTIQVEVINNNLIAPVIFAKDVIILKKDSVFSILNGVTAIDKNGKDITDKIKVIKNTVDINKTGMYEVTYKVTDDDNLSTEKTIQVEVINSTYNDSNNNSSTQITTNEISGKDRYETSIKISEKYFDKAENVVLINSEKMADALCSTPFASIKNAPILLSSQNNLDSSVKKEINRLQTKNIYIIGGLKVIGIKVEKEIEKMGINVIRIGGTDRIETSLLVAKEIQKNKKIKNVALVNAYTGLADAVSIASASATNNMSILFTDKDFLDKNISNFINSNKLNSYILGDINSISKNIENEIASDYRFSGKNRIETNVKIISYFYKNKHLNNIFIAKSGITNESHLIDALLISIAGVKEESPVLLVGTVLDLDKYQKDFIINKEFKCITRIGEGENENVFNEIINLKSNER